MNYSDIPMGVKVQISVTNGGDSQARFVSRVMKTGDKSLLVIPFMHKGVRVNFNGTNVKIHMEVPDGEGNNWTFKNCKIETVKKNGLLYHRIITPMSEGIENRRGERRTYVWQPAIFTIEGITDQLFTTLKDVSPSGFACVVDPKKRRVIATGKNVTCTINERDGTVIHLRGKVIRKEKMDQYILYGCRSAEKTEEVLNFIERLNRRKEEQEKKEQQANK